MMNCATIEVSSIQQKITMDSLHLNSFHHRIDTVFHEIKESQGEKFPISEIIQDFAEVAPQLMQTIDTLSLKQLGHLKNLVKKINYLSSKKVTLYKNKRFGFLEQFFSTLRNFIKLGVFKDTAHLGLDLTNEIDAKIKDSLLNFQFSPRAKALDAPPSDLRQKTTHLSVEEGEEFLSFADFYNQEEEVREEKIKEINTEPKISLDLAKEETTIKKVLNTFTDCWEHAEGDVRGVIRTIWSFIISRDHVVKWKKTERANEYRLTLDKEMLGEAKGEVPGQAVLKKEILFTFTEEALEGGRFRQVIDISGIVQRLGGWKPDVSLVKMVFLSRPNNPPRCILHAGKSLFTVSREVKLEALIDLLTKIEWS